MFCKYCGNEIPEGARFCAKCGQETAFATEDVGLEQETFEQEDFVQEEEYSYVGSGRIPVRRPFSITAIVLGIIGLPELIFGIYGTICIITGFNESTGTGMLLVWSITFGVLAILFGAIYVVNNKRLQKRSKYIGLILGIIDAVGSIIMFIIL